MSARSRQREARRQLLRQRFAQEREQLAGSLQAVQRHLLPIDRTLTAIRFVRGTPLLIGILTALFAGVAMLFRGRTRRPRVSRFSWLLPLAGPLLKLLEVWWRERRSGTATHVFSEPTGRPEHP